MLESIVWYNEAQPGLGRSYYNSVKQALKSIKSNPFMFPVFYKELRMATVKKFPFIGKGKIIMKAR
jgi:hypothetical protein